MLDEWIERLSRMSVSDAEGLPGMEPGREDLLLQGMILMREIVASFQRKRVRGEHVRGAVRGDTAIRVIL